MQQAFQFKKKYGQNFLKNSAIIDKIVTIASVPKNTLIVEVGPGAGALTSALAKLNDVKVLAYEIDTSLEDPLIAFMHQYPNVTIYFQDFLKSNLEEDVAAYTFDHLYFISNVPYYITTPIIFKIIDSNLPFEKIVMMVQKEVGLRFCAKPGQKEYGALTVLLDYYFTLKKEGIVDRNQFIPKPNVDSMIVSFTERLEKEKLADPAFFRKLVHDSFQFKRKTIRNNLKNYPLEIVEKVLHTYHYDLNVRAEQLPYSVFVDLANALCSK